jgi:hypothetical protein
LLRKLLAMSPCSLYRLTSEYVGNSSLVSALAAWHMYPEQATRFFQVTQIRELDNPSARMIMPETDLANEQSERKRFLTAVEGFVSRHLAAVSVPGEGPIVCAAEKKRKPESDSEMSPQKKRRLELGAAMLIANGTYVCRSRVLPTGS